MERIDLVRLQRRTFLARTAENIRYIRAGFGSMQGVNDVHVT
jgi:hypothetical protein